MSIPHAHPAGTVPVSFEVYPPRDASSFAALYDVIDRLAAVDPSFISVTYGAGGSSGGRSLEVLTHILRETQVEPLAHLTCIGSSYAGSTALIREFLDAGIRSFLALRGDPPGGEPGGDGDLESAAQLVQLIERVQAERTPYTEAPIPGVPGAARVERRDRVEIAVAAFPNGHPRSRHPHEHLDALVAKQAAGATFAITQLFFHADDYLAFVERARAAGVVIPILPGVMPITSPARLRRIVDLTGEELPGELAVALDVEPTTAGRRAIGVAHAARLCREVLAGGAPGIHLYAFNSSETVLATLAAAGVTTPQKETTA
ncbi:MULTISPECIES: methylenetetrahydrofolate reductase [unclassified Microbacterium]|uniref:methylenetetrahydrofolate reductase n=1 Tax=unclassified Microbacterium TaxID=2609290 RepID=UPI00387037E2